MPLFNRTAPQGRRSHFQAAARRGLLVLCLSVFFATSLYAQAPATGQVHVLSAQEVESTFPATVYYLGKTAPLQLRNAAAVRFGPQAIFFAGLVDTSGYASGVQEVYQMYLVLEQPTQFGSATLPAGAYGAGFVKDHFVVMDLGGHTVAEGPTSADEHVARPRPLQIVQASGGTVQLYLGRRFVVLHPQGK